MGTLADRSVGPYGQALMPRRDVSHDSPVLLTDGDRVRLAGTNAAQLLVIGNEADVDQAFADYRAGRLG